MTPILENGEWGKRREKRHKLDQNSEWSKKANGKWDYENVQLTDWNSREKAREWRKALADTINAANERLDRGCIGNTAQIRSWDLTQALKSI